MLITFLKILQRLKQEWQKSPVGTRKTEEKNLVWFGEIERKLAKLLKTVPLTIALLNLPKEKV